MVVIDRLYCTCIPWGHWDHLAGRYLWGHWDHLAGRYLWGHWDHLAGRYLWGHWDHLAGRYVPLGPLGSSSWWYLCMLPHFPSHVPCPPHISPVPLTYPLSPYISASHVPLTCPPHMSPVPLPSHVPCPPYISDSHVPLTCPLV
jgi:hypothetical protein